MRGTIWDRRSAAWSTVEYLRVATTSVSEFSVDNQSGKAVDLYKQQFLQIELTAVGYTPKGDINPCSDFEGMKARVQYVESSDKTVDGQVVAVELRK